MKKPSQHLIIAEAPRRITKIGMTIGIDLGDVWSHYCTLNEDGEVVDRGRFRTSPSGVEKWFTDLPPVRIAMEAGTHSIWISEQLQELGHDRAVGRGAIGCNQLQKFQTDDGDSSVGHCRSPTSSMPN